MRNINRRYPCVADMEIAARTRMPGFVRDYLIGGLGREDCLLRNANALSDVLLMPRYLRNADNPNLTSTLFGRAYDAPFGVAPIGLAGLLWPGCEASLAIAARAHNVPH